MAPTYRSASSAFAFPGSANTVINKPSGAANGDHLLAAFFADNGFYGGLGDLTPPSPWLTVAELLVGNAPILGIYQLICGASEPSTYTWVGNDGSDRSLVMICHQAGSFDATTPIGAVNLTDWSRQFQASAGTNVPAAAITPPVDDCQGINFAFGQNGSSWTPHSGWTERLDGTNGGPTGSVHTNALGTGSTGVITAVASSSVPVNQGAGILVALRPVAAVTDARLRDPQRRQYEQLLAS